MSDSPQICPTCGEAYSKPPTERAMFCSNSFHCCKDCVWDWQVEGGMAKGELLTMCDFCAKRQAKWDAEWAARST